MFTRFAFTIYVIFIMAGLSRSDDQQNQLCTTPDTSLIASSIFHWCTPDGQIEYSYGWFYSYNKGNRILTRSYSYEDAYWNNNEFELFVYSNEQPSLDKSTIVKQSTAENWELRSRLTERRHDDADTVTEDYTSIAFRNIYVKNSNDQVVERIYQTGSYDVWNEHSRTYYEYDNRGNKISQILEEPAGNPVIRLSFEYNNNNQLINYRNQVMVNGVWTDQQKEIYMYDSKHRLVLYVNLSMIYGVLDSAQKREYIYATSKCNPVTRINEYEFRTDRLHLVEQRIEYSNHSGLVTETQCYYYESDSTISRSKFKYEYDRFRNLILTRHYYKDTYGEWKKDYFETKSYLFIDTHDNQSRNSCNREWDDLSEIERFYSDPLNYDRQVTILDSNGKVCKVKKLNLGLTGQGLDTLKEITPKQLLDLRKKKDHRIFWKGNASILMGTHNFH